MKLRDWIYVKLKDYIKHISTMKTVKKPIYKTTMKQAPEYIYTVSFVVQINNED